MDSPQRVLDAWYEGWDMVGESSRQNNDELLEEGEAVLPSLYTLFLHLVVNGLHYGWDLRL